ncbi:MAG TPA: ketoacyl-ACP synthase III [Candidatus Faecalibacterium avium]|uniref:beta-ketoacyl-ACP synthase III n=1 Tax=Faecalibacterium sp. An121 TaxID=1965550 RepID=UPI000B36E1F8|nr:beta-ketoacyl-ACP synthase III [Faecalibacterium sp. An121]OUQ38355.1 3-oxoacyl-ACP synthase [Faecalibacterium sp. An121]HIV44286.1 ketoacyl-ACP synthase III [Candidatus Faecalibacterium avium]
MSGIKLISTGSALPVREVTNFDMEKLVETSDEWISTRTGISARRFCSGEECHTSLCLAAARQALERSGLRPEQIGVCLVATLTQDTMTPSTACVLQKELGLPEDTVCFDLNAACAGFVYGLHTAECLLAAASRKYGLVIGCEVLSRITDFTDRSTCVLFGDGAGAAILEWGEDYPSLCAVMGSRGNRQVLMIPGVNTGSPNFIHMDGKEVFRFAVDVLPKCAKEVAAKAGISLDQVDRFVFHQANQRILDYAIKKLKIDPARCAGNIARTGNTSAASVPLLLDELVTSGALRSGQRALCAGFGGGLTWAGALLQLA